MLKSSESALVELFNTNDYNSESLKDVESLIGKDNRNAISFMQKCSADTGESIFDHLVDVIKKIIDERPSNVADYFEEFSKSVRKERYREAERSQRGLFKKPRKYTISMKILQELSLQNESNMLNNDSLNNFMKMQHYWSVLGIGYSSEKSFQLSVSMERLMNSCIIKRSRFWGTIYGLKNNYYIAEVDLTDAEHEKRMACSEEEALELELRKTQLNLKTSIIGETVSNQELGLKLEKTSISTIHDDLNRKVYFVCTELLSDWIELPSIAPNEIALAQQIRKYFSGNLDTNINSYPKFDGTEKNYLRAVIARISNGTFISPLNYYKLNMLNTSDQSVLLEDLLVLNTNYINESLADTDLLDIDHWIHSRSLILPGGTLARIEHNQNSFIDSTNNKEVINLELNTSDATINTIPTEIIMTRSEKILKLCSNDVFTNRTQSWTIFKSANFDIPCKIIVAKSNVWPGSYSIATDRHTDHIYIGWGYKALDDHHAPAISWSVENESDELLLEEKTSSKMK